jgi:cellulose synthase/poly-beta-1,6-N-acetylglucosamine synthase-like glycosyltransferase
MELIVRLHRYCRERRMPYRITFVPDPVAWTECPESLRILGRQRERWQRGLTETLIRHRHMLFNPRYGHLGLLVVPYYVFFEMLGPAIEVIGYVSFGITLAGGRASPEYIVAFVSLAVVFGLALSIAAIALEELSFRRYPRTVDLVSLLALALLESLGYRQLSTWWRARGLLAALRGKRGWGEMTRKGFSVAKS